MKNLDIIKIATIVDENLVAKEVYATKIDLGIDGYEFAYRDLHNEDEVGFLGVNIQITELSTGRLIVQGSNGVESAMIEAKAKIERNIDFFKNFVADDKDNFKQLPVINIDFDTE